MHMAADRLASVAIVCVRHVGLYNAGAMLHSHRMLRISANLISHGIYVYWMSSKLAVFSFVWVLFCGMQPKLCGAAADNIRRSTLKLVTFDGFVTFVANVSAPHRLVTIWMWTRPPGFDLRRTRGVASNAAPLATPVERHKSMNQWLAISNCALGVTWQCGSVV